MPLDQSPYSLVPVEGDPFAPPKPSPPSAGQGISLVPVEGDPFALPKPTEEQPGILSRIGQGITHLGASALHGAERSLQETAQAGEKHPEPLPQEQTPEAQPFALSDIPHPINALGKAFYQLGHSAPSLGLGLAAGTLGSAMAGGPEDPVGAAVGLAAGALGAAGGAMAQSIGPTFAGELKQTPGDADGAWTRSLEKTALEGGITGVAWSVFPYAPAAFQTTLKRILFQTFGAQPAVAAAGQAASNVLEGQPVTQGVGQAALQSVPGTLVPLVGIEGARALGRRIVGAPPEPGGTPPTPEAAPEVGVPVRLPGPDQAPTDFTVQRYSPDGKIAYLLDPDGNLHPMATSDVTARQVEQPPALLPAVSAEEETKQAPPPPAAVAPIIPAAEAAAQPPPREGRIEPPPLATPAPEPASSQQGPEDIAAEKARQALAVAAGIPPPPPVAPARPPEAPVLPPEEAAADQERQKLAAVAQPLPPVTATEPPPAPTPAQPVPPPPMPAPAPAPAAEPRPAALPHQPEIQVADDPFADMRQLGLLDEAQEDTPLNQQSEVMRRAVLARVGVKAGVYVPISDEMIEREGYLPGTKVLAEDLTPRQLATFAAAATAIPPRESTLTVAPEQAPPAEPTPPPLSASPRNPQEVGREIARAREDTDTNPTKAQQSSGNYAKGRVDFHGLPFVMENPEGSIRRGGPPENPWEVEMPADYGYLARSEGADGDQVDAYLGPHPESGHAFVIDQVDADTGAFDEHKVMLGFESWPEARAIYERAFSDGRGAERIGNMTPMTLSEIKTWLRDGDMQNPIGQGEFGFERINPPAPTPGTPTEAKAPPFQLADAITEALEDARSRNRAFKATDLQAMAEKVYGGTLAEGKFTRQSMYDALELGVNQWVTGHPLAIDPRADLTEAKDIAGKLEAVKNLLPTQTVRAGEKDRMQQFSTPPDYAYTAAWLGNIRPTDRILEPSAGNGSLVAMAKNAGPSEVVANELFLPRAEALDALGTTRTFRENAEQLNNILPADVKPSLVLMNPPFSQTAGRMGDKTVLMTGARHIDQALARLDPGGRLVAIVGRGMTMGSPTFQNWWAGISRSFDVRANIGIPGSVYQKYGTTFGTQLLVIDKVPPSGRPIVGGNAASLPEAMERLDAVRTDRPADQGTAGESVAGQPSGLPVAEPGAPPGEPRSPLPGPTPGGGIPSGPTGAGAGPELPVGAGARVRGIAGPEPQPGPGDALVHQQPEHPVAGGAEPNAAVGPGGSEELGGSGAEPHGVVLQPEGGAGPVLPASGEPPRVEPSGEPAGPPPEAVRVDELAAEPTPGAGVTEAVYEPYKPQRIAIEGAQAHPGDLVQSAAMASVMPPMVDYAPRLPKSLSSTGALSDAQLEAITYAGHAHSQILPAVAGETPYRRGYFIGDGTGVGKGREVAGIILDNFQQGRQKALWLSESRTLVEDARRDWTGLGGKKEDVFDLGKVKAGGDLKASRGIGFLTYDTLKGGERAGKDAEGKAIPGQRRIDQIINWLGKDFDGVIALDECVPAGTMISTLKGQKSIESLEVGDVIMGFDHASKRVIPTVVKRTFSRMTSADLYAVGPVLMTGNHPVWTENMGYIPAIWIDARDRVRYLSQDGKHTHMRKLRERVFNKIPAQSKSLLQSIMYHTWDIVPHRPPALSDVRKSSRGTRSGGAYSIGSDEANAEIPESIGRIPIFGSQSIQRSCHGKKGCRSQSGKRVRTLKRRQRATTISPASDVAQSVAGVETGLSVWDKAETAWISNTLQDRPCISGIEDCSRGGWRRPSNGRSAHVRCQEDGVPPSEGMACTKISQQRNPGRYGACGSKNYGRVEVFNIETGTANYFANHLLVHNSHNLANVLPTKGARGVKPAAAKALAGLELQQKLPNARVVYVSATGATEVSNLGYASRLGLWGRGTAFPDSRAFVNSIGSGGIAAMELVARDMKAMGSYLSRSLSYDDVKYDRVEHQLSPDDKEIYDGLAEGWQHVLRNMQAALELTGPEDENGIRRADRGQKMAAMSAFWSGHQRFFNQIITSMQMPTVTRAVERDLKEGRQAVLQLVNTNEASQKRAIEKRVAAEGAEGEDLYEDLDMTPRDQLAQMIDKSFPTQQIETYVDENGNERTRGVVDSAGNRVHNPEAVAMKEALLARVGSLRVPDGPLERLINHFGPDKVAEVTGRGQRIVHVPDENGVVRAQKEMRGTNTNAAEANAFQNAKKPILVFSQAGGTGRSYHADLTSPSADAQRSHYLVQAGWRADKAIQGFGRTHRTNQASAPIFHLVTTDLQGQKRFISSIARRLSQLGALTKGERRAGESGMFSARDNLEGPEANAAIRDFWRSLQRNDIQGVDPRDFEQQTGMHLHDGKGEDSEPPEVTQFLNRLLSLKYDMQNHVFGEFDRRLQDAVDRASAAGTLDTGTETLKGDRINKTEEKTVYTDPQSGAETKYVRLKVDTKNKPASFDQVSSGQRLTAGRTPEFYATSKTSGKVFAVSEASSRTDANGRVSDMYRLSDPLQWHFIERGRLDDDRYWSRIEDEKQARDLWDKQVAALPEYNSEDVHLITGAVLPIWDRLSGTPKVYRLQTDGGERMLGRVIPNDRIDHTLQALGAETSGRTYAPQEVADRILRGDRATLANGWALKRSLVAGEPRIEVVGPNYTHRDELARDGVFTERIQYDTRFFIPTGVEATPTLERLLERRPVTEMASTGRAQGLAEGAPSGWTTAEAGPSFTELFPHRDTTAEAQNFRAAGSYGEGPAGGNAAARDYVFMEGTNTGREHFAAVGPDGQIADAGTNGSRDTIRFSDETLRRIYNPDAPALAFHHNHPSDSPLSIPDLMALSAHGMASVAAHGHDGRISSASLTPEAREALFQLDPNERQQRLKHIAMGAELIAADATDPLVKRGVLPKQRADEILGEARNRLLAANGYIDYVSTRTLPGWLTARLAQFLRGQNAGEIGDRLNRSAGALRPEEAMARISDTHAEIAAGRSAGAGGAGAGAPSAGTPRLEFAEEKPRELEEGEPAARLGGAGGFPPSGGGAGPSPPTPASPAGRPSAFGILKKGFASLTRDAQMKISPMAAGGPEGKEITALTLARAAAKDFLNADRAARYQRQSVDNRLLKFSKEDRGRMWDVGDAASVAAQQRGMDAGQRILDTLDPREQASMSDMDKYGRNLWQRAVDAGKVSGDALPFYTTRAIVIIGEDGRATRVGSTGARASELDQLGINLRTNPGQRRSYLTAAETEEAAQAKFGPQAKLVRDIRVVPMAQERLERAVAGQQLVNDIKAIGRTIGKETVSDSEGPNFFTIEHPALKTYRPARDAEGNIVRDADGNVALASSSIYIHRDFEGPLRAALTQEDGALYRAAMRLKAGAVSLIMNSPLIHNEVVWGRALPAMPGKVATFKAYFEGNAFRRGVPYTGVASRIAEKFSGRQADMPVNPEMDEAIRVGGYVPVGNRGYIQDITGIAEDPSLRAGRSITASLLGSAGDLWSPRVGLWLREAIDKAGDFWHHALLWDRVEDLHAGLYKNLRDDMLSKGVPRLQAVMDAANLSNRYVGMIPGEAMNRTARKVANCVLFSVSYKFGNFAIAKDVFTGLPRDQQAVLMRDLGEIGRAQAVSYARAKMLRTVILDVGLYYAMNALLQTGIQMMARDQSASDVEKEYTGLLSRAINRIQEHPLEALNPLGFLASLSPTSENEPGKENRILWTHASDGTAIYLRTPVGKFGEELVGWAQQPVQTLKNAQGTLSRPITNLLMNDSGFGRKVYDADYHGISGVIKNIGRVVWEFMRSQVPETQFDALGRILTGNAKEGDIPQAVAPFAGFTVSHGYPGGEAQGLAFDTDRQSRDRVREAMPGIRELIHAGKTDDAVQQMMDLGMPRWLVDYEVKVTLDPSARLSASALKRFQREATPEQAAAMQRQLTVQKQGQMTPP